jgi:hypothetical protein
MLSILCAVLLALAATGPAAAEGPSLRTGVQVNAGVQTPASPLTVGDPFTYTVEVRCPSGADVVLPEPGKSLAPLEVRDLQQASVAEGDGQRVTLSLQLAAFTTGEVSIPAFNLQYTAPGTEAVALPVAESKVTITSVLTPDAQDIRDIREPFGPQEKPAGHLWWLMALLALAGGALAWWARRRRGAPAGTSAPRPETAHERALAALDALRGLRLDDPEALQAYYTGVSTVMREFLEARFAVRAMEATTRMIRRELEARSVPAAWQERVCGLLARADLVKFARQTIAPAQAAGDLEEARQAVLEVVPTPAPSAEVKPASAP